MYLQLAEGENDGNYQALAESASVLENYVFVPAGFLPEFEKDTYVRADYFNKFDPTTAEALINALMSQQTVGLSVIGVGAIAAGGLKLAKGIIEKRKANVAAGTAKPIFGAGGIFKGKPGGLIDKIKGGVMAKIQNAAAAAPEMQTKSVKLPEDPVGGSVQLPGGQFNVGFQPAEQPAAASGSFFQKYKVPLLIGGGLLAVGGIYLATRKKSRRR
jgi:hypothetical protein